MDYTKKLLAKLPANYHERVELLESEPDLIDDCKLMLYFAKGWLLCGEDSSIPVRTITEAIRYIKDTERGC